MTRTREEEDCDVGLVRTFTRHCHSVISRWLVKVTMVTLLVAVRNQFTRPAVGVCCLCSGQQYSPPSPLQPALTSPPPPHHSLQSTAAVNGMRGGGRRVPAGAADSRWRLLDSVTSFWEMKLDTALKNGYRLPGYHFTTLLWNKSIKSFLWKLSLIQGLQYAVFQTKMQMLNRLTLTELCNYCFSNSNKSGPKPPWSWC